MRKKNILTKEKFKLNLTTNIQKKNKREHFKRVTEKIQPRFGMQLSCRALPYHTQGAKFDLPSKIKNRSTLIRNKCKRTSLGNILIHIGFTFMINILYHHDHGMK